MNVNDDLDPVETDEWTDARRAVQQYRDAGNTNFAVRGLVHQANGAPHANV
ncbi:MAG: hypothetical protein Q8O58_02835 [Gallionella sp.]|nr:hypothetical protein [Gallionella sp.]